VKTLLFFAAAVTLHAQGAAEGSRPVTPCAILNARATSSDTARIQGALNLCGPGKAVVLWGEGPNSTFTSGPLLLPRGVTLFLAHRVVLRAPRDPHAYDIAPGSCGAPPKGKEATCKPFVFAYQAAFSGVAGDGTIDGQGAAPELVSSYESQGFSLSGVTLRNAKAIAAAIYKTTNFVSADLKIDSPTPPEGIGMLLSNVTGAEVEGARIRVAGESIALRSSILGPTTNVRIRGARFFGGLGVVNGTGDAGAVRNVTVEGVSNVSADSPEFAHAPAASYALDLKAPAAPGDQRSLTVSPGESIQVAVDKLPVNGGEITVKPGTYREVITIRKPNVRIHGEDADPSKTVIVFNRGPADGGTFASGTVFVEAPDVTIDHLTISNDIGNGKGQGVALAAIADRAIFRNLRLLGAQDTLWATSRYCYGDYGPCEPARQYFADTYVEGNTDFIFGDALAVFERCQLHGISPGTVMYTAQSRHTAAQKESAYIFDHCRLTASPREQGSVSLGRPWRPYATVIFLQTQIEAPVIPAGWTEWARFGVPSLPTVFYAEFESTGPGASAAAREPHSHQLTAAEAAKWAPVRVLAGKDHWNPASRP
jgi:pectin methylesterase-like acyl-CoA thioesterase